MLEYHQEIRDPIHIFIKIDPEEKLVIDSQPFQRLRNIHQLALTYFIYPGAVHSRFEHSLGVMELAGRIFDVLTSHQNMYDDSIRSIVPWSNLCYWRRVVKLAALCHDLGHIPFSHGAEGLLPPGWDHEELTKTVIFGDELLTIWKKIKVDPEDVAKVALGPHKYRKAVFDVWDAIMAEIITGDAFGADRMDYLLRDSHHAGVTYGRFDHNRLIDKLRLLPRGEDGSVEPAIGLERGGIHAAEALLIARYFMFSQLYYHKVRRIYDQHLKQFLKDRFVSPEMEENPLDWLKLTDHEVTAAWYAAASQTGLPGHAMAATIIGRKHFRLLYERNPSDHNMNRQSSLYIYKAACVRYGEDKVFHDYRVKEEGAPDFPVLLRDGRIEASSMVSELLTKIPIPVVDYVFLHPDFITDGRKWLADNRISIIKGDAK